MVNIVSFETHVALVHLIQSTTSETTEQIFSYFHGLALNIADTAVEQYKNKRFSKDLVWTYKDTNIPYRLTVRKTWWEQKGSVQGKVNVTVDVKFPGQLFCMNVSDMVDRITETSLGLSGAELSAKFPKPKTKVPRGLRETLAQVTPPSSVDYSALPTHLRAKYAK